MTKEDIIRMALEANFYESEIGNAEDCFVQFAALVAAAEREACAKVVLGITNDDAGNPYKQALRIGADAIRARGQA